MIYRAMLERLEYDPDHPRRARDELDRALDVGEWRIPGVPRRTRTNWSAAPSWWHGDEEASQSFLRAVGVVT